MRVNYKKAQTFKNNDTIKSVHQTFLRISYSVVSDPNFFVWCNGFDRKHKIFMSLETLQIIMNVFFSLNYYILKYNLLKYM